jgi:hypothetical protein
MFASAKTSKLAQRSLGALRLTRSFLTLEDDYDVDWEVDGDEQLTQTHPHRAPLRGPGRRSRRSPARRSGEPVPRSQICLSPVGPAPADTAGAPHQRRACPQPSRPRSRH